MKLLSGAGIRCACVCFVAATNARAQVSNYNPRDDQYRMLGMMRARAEFRKASEDFERARALSTRGMLSQSDLSERRVAFERVRVDYLQQSVAALLSAAHLSIVRATKERRADGSLAVVVRVHSVNTRSAADETARLLMDSTLETPLRPDVIPSIFVSLKTETGANGVTISKPIERQIRQLELGQESSVEFALLKDVNDVVVSLAYADKVDERRVWLDNAAESDAVAMRAAQFSLEGDFGASVTYDLTLERAHLGSAPVRLKVEHLPASARYEFRDPDTKVRVGQVRFPDGQTSKRLQLVVALPPSADGDLKPDESLKFSVAALTSNSETEKTATATRVALELIPRGVARAELRTTSLYFESAAGDSVTAEATVRNTGSGAIRAVALAADPATGWNAHVVPATLSDLALGEARTIRIVFLPPSDAAVGDYEQRIRVVSKLTGKRLDDEDKIIRIKVSGHSSGYVTIALLSGLAAMTAAIVLASKRLGAR